jgi:hypothetical protein
VLQVSFEVEFYNWLSHSFQNFQTSSKFISWTLEVVQLRKKKNTFYEIPKITIEIMKIFEIYEKHLWILKQEKH